MVVPRNRLLAVVAVVTLPVSLIVAARPAVFPVGGLVTVVLAAIAVLDAISARRSMEGIGVELPPIVRMSKDRQARIEARIRNDSERQRLLRIALALPRDINEVTPEREVILADGAKWSRLECDCVPSRRGSYKLDSAWVEGVSRLGLWSARRKVPVQSEVRVYPDLLRERKTVASLFLNRGAFGLHSERQIGQGREFEKLREYIPGDALDEIHWKATARRGKPVTKVFQIERTQEVYVAIDASRLSARRMERAPDNPVLERLVTASLILGLAAERQGDLFGLLTFHEKVETFLRASNGKGHFAACREAIYTLHPKIVAPDFDEVCTFMRLRLRRRALIIFLTSLDDPSLAEGFVRNIALLRRQHLVVVMMIRQPGVQALFSEGNVEHIDDIYRHLGGHLRWQKLRQLEHTLQHMGVRLAVVENERLSAELVAQYLKVKQRQLI